jgi:hypothetical protein
MTTPEHQLVIEMFKQQALLYGGLVELLKSRGVLERGDLKAFDSLVSASSREALEQNVVENYLRAARVLSVNVAESELI